MAPSLAELPGVAAATEPKPLTALLDQLRQCASGASPAAEEHAPLPNEDAVASMERVLDVLARAELLPTAIRRSGKGGVYALFVGEQAHRKVAITARNDGDVLVIYEDHATLDGDVGVLDVDDEDGVARTLASVRAWVGGTRR